MAVDNVIAISPMLARAGIDLTTFAYSMVKPDKDLIENRVFPLTRHNQYETKHKEHLALEQYLNTNDINRILKRSDSRAYAWLISSIIELIMVREHLKDLKQQDNWPHIKEKLVSQYCKENDVPAKPAAKEQYAAIALAEFREKLSKYIDMIDLNLQKLAKINAELVPIQKNYLDELEKALALQPEALDELQELVEQLDLTPEEKQPFADLASVIATPMLSPEVSSQSQTPLGITPQLHPNIVKVNKEFSEFIAQYSNKSSDSLLTTGRQGNFADKQHNVEFMANEFLCDQMLKLKPSPENRPQLEKAAKWLCSCRNAQLEQQKMAEMNSQRDRVLAHIESYDSKLNKIVKSPEAKQIGINQQLQQQMPGKQNITPNPQR